MKLIRIISMAFLLPAVLLTSCTKEDQVDHSIAVDAGAGQSVKLPANTATLTGTVTIGQTAGTSYLWTLVSGPNIPAFVNHSSQIATVSNLAAGTYIFQFQATNSYGVTGYDTTSVVVIPNTLQTVILQPSGNANEGVINIYYPTNWVGNNPQLVMAAWTRFGDPFNSRTCVKFDYTGIPAGAVVENAKLYLYADHAPENGNLVDAHFGTNNACYIQRILSDWVLPDPFTWNKPPATTTVNQAVIPQSTSAFDDRVIDVTALVQDMVTNGNNGFLLRLQNEVIYNCQQYCSSNDIDATKHPKLVITYH